MQNSWVIFRENHHQHTHTQLSRTTFFGHKFWFFFKNISFKCFNVMWHKKNDDWMTFIVVHVIHFYVFFMFFTIFASLSVSSIVSLTHSLSPSTFYNRGFYPFRCVWFLWNFVLRPFCNLYCVCVCAKVSFFLA